MVRAGRTWPVSLIPVEGARVNLRLVSVRAGRARLGLTTHREILLRRLKVQPLEDGAMLQGVTTGISQMIMAVM
jgi:hypothetical protein